MSAVHYLHDEIAVVGWSCRLPGANSISDLWSLLLEGRCSVSQVPADRFSLQRFGHPRKQERGRSYTWAAGVLDDVFGFDPTVFGISPREAEQMDPQQRILLQLTWEALEDAGIRPSALRGKDVGVFVGGSLTEYAYAIAGDPAIADMHFGTGNALSVLANRISYVFDLHGPSLTVDTACSSSLVALHQAAEALRSGRIDTAIVGGVNVIGSPCSFIGFSQASMLSPTGRCRAFSEDADGFVRAEGGVILVLRRASVAQADHNPLRGFILASDVNSDGRTNGIALPSFEAQEALLKRVYSRARIAADRLAFVEAHGTGTPAGDPIEATALGRGLGVERSQPLPIGSLKTNVGHLEAASGIAGVVKALLSLNHGVLPPSLHFTKPNPHIDLDQLKLRVCDKPLLLAHAAQQCAGVNSFGFGGTNAHVVVAGGRNTAETSKGAGGSFLFLSAATKPALRSLAERYAERIRDCSDEDTATIANAVAHRRERLSQRLVVSTTKAKAVIHALDAFIDGADNEHLTTGEAASDELPIAFVYSGNGSQWPGMGRAAYRLSAAFRQQFEQIDAYFKDLAGWSLREALFSDTLEERLGLTSVAQPLIFAIQNATTAALRARGLQPAAVFGHSVGEVAAAAAAGALDLRTAVKVIYFRSTHQEHVRGKGRMAALIANPDTFRELNAAAPEVEIAAINSPRALTVAGPVEQLAALGVEAKRQGKAFLDLDLDYPFHTAAMASVEQGVVADLGDLVPRDGAVPFISTVTGSVLPGVRLNAHYWWRNVREPVQFAKAVQEAAKHGVRFFIEIGPRPMLLKHIADNLEEYTGRFATLATLDRNDPESDPFDTIVAKALVGGADLNSESLFGPPSAGSVSLPTYPWQQQSFRWASTSETLGIFDGTPHPLAGTRYNGDALEWRAYIDTAAMPELIDHRVGDQIILPGTGFLEIALIVARQWLQTENVAIGDFEILKPLDLSGGETQEVLTRVSPISNSFEILSRPRLSQAGWLLNCRGKMFHGSEHDGERKLDLSKANETAGDDVIYRLAASSGLHYGPAFRLASQASVFEGGLISVDLVPPERETTFLLDPMRLDAGIHGVFLTFRELRAEERGVTYIPVRMDKIQLVQPRVAPHRTIIEILSKNERSIFANCHVFDKDDNRVATLRGVRCQAVPVRHSASLDATAFIELLQPVDGVLLGQSGVSANPNDIIVAARAEGLAVETAAISDKGLLLLEGWAAAFAYEAASALAIHNVLDLDRLIAGGRLPEHLRSWFVLLLRHLGAAALAKEEEEGRWTLIPDPLLPNAASLVRAIAAEHPDRAGELLVAGEVTGAIAEIVETGALTGSTVSSISREFHEIANGWNVDAGAIPSRVLERMLKTWPKHRVIRILQVGHGPLTQALSSLGRTGEIRHTLIEPDGRCFHRAQLSLSRNTRVRLLDLTAGLDDAEYDLMVATGGLSRLPADFPLTRLRTACAPNGLLIAVEPAQSLFRTVINGLMTDAGYTTPRDLKEWRSELAAAGFDQPQTLHVRCGHDVGQLLAAKAINNSARGEVPQDSRRSAWIVAGESAESRELASDLVQRLAGRNVIATAEVDRAAPAHIGNPGSNIAVRLMLFDGGRDPVGQLSKCCLEIKTFAERLLNTKATMWLVFAGALPSETREVDPIQTGAWAFARVVANEFPQLDVRRVDIASPVSSEWTATALERILLSGTAETELQITEIAIRAVRVEPIKTALERQVAAGPAAANLQRRSTVGQRLFWQPIERRNPGASEVEIAVEATGVNFRDLMWSLMLLPDDMLEDGFTGPTLGLECAGRVIQVGASVKSLKEGDRVLGFAPSAFATHLTVKASQLEKLPAEMSCEAAATIPVAFMTAYYSLVTLAELRRGEWVLIHAGAGGVGMAAIQIARDRGAKIIATAGSLAKRNLLAALGVPHVLDSRSVLIADDVRRITGAGVDVVLNSLAGEAMERSVACLRPFGRFVELGKRDYVSNTHLGLRPFRKNLSYFGVDIDQLIAGRRATGRKVFAALMQQFKKGALRPLPYSVFPGAEVSEAFHLMQQSGHVGKIVVRPPDLSALRKSSPPMVIDSRRTHLVTGAFGGFGLETARWLVQRGARNLVLVGRRGASSEEAKALLSDLAAQGVKALAEPCDVADARSVERLFDKIQRTMPPVAGVIHCAMVLDDAIVANLDADRLRVVLNPKVKGAENLDFATHGLKLDYFVLFSSVTTIIGNPGQGAYVSANAYMEGLARRRRKRGLPALAVGWGPISDAGVVARSRALQANLQKVGGARGMTAREALDLMAEALAQQPPDDPTLAVVTIAHAEGLSVGAERLPVLRSPTYAAFVRKGGNQADSAIDKINLRQLLKMDDRETLQRKVAKAIAAELAHVLRFQEEEISLIRPLGELGLDSLMALELAMNLEATFDIELRRVGGTGDLTIVKLADEIIAQAEGQAGNSQDPTAAILAAHHGNIVEQEHLAALQVVLEAEYGEKRLSL